MRSARFVLPPVLVVVALLVVGMKASDPPGTQMKAFADSFLGSLSDEQRAVAVMPYDTPQRTDWHFIPKKVRKGVVLRQMNAAQKTAALRLVRAALSEAGYDKASKIMMMENLLNTLEGDRSMFERDPNKYFVTIFGTPSNTDAWGLSFEGHHLSLNFVCRGGKVVDSTPQVLAANPAIVMNDVEGPIKKGTRLLRMEEELAFKLVNSFNDSQKEKAVIAEKAPREVRFAGQAQPSPIGDPVGIAFGDLNDEQAKQLKALVETYTDTVADKVAEVRRKLIDGNGWENVYFAWAGATEPGIGHYYRVRGKEFLIEFVNTQPDAAGNPANHIHAVWRDLTGDFDLPIE